jgi:hydroxyacylglutathione hydrolase
MHAALTKLGGLPDDTLVWNGHEYTKGSVKFGLKIEPENKELQGYVVLTLTLVDLSGRGADD